ncbi:MAG: tetratricopeptide repeat protein [Bryobacterales bacterium]
MQAGNLVLVLAAVFAIPLTAQSATRFEPLYREALARREASFGSEDSRTTQSLVDLALFLNEHERPGEAEPLLRRAIATLEKMESRENLASAVVNLADVRLALGEGEDAEQLLRRALALREGPAGVGEILDRLTALLRLKGDLDEAEVLSRRALSFGRTAERLRGLAVTLDPLGKDEEAVTLHREALALQEREFGSVHPQVALTLNSIALLDFGSGDVEAAAPLFERALLIFERTLGPESPEAATALDNLGNVRRAQRDYQSAEKLLIRALDIRRNALGEDHADTAVTCNNLAGVYHVQGKLDEAEPLYRQAIAIREQQLGEYHLDATRALYNLGHLLRQKGNSAAAIEAFSRALKAAEAALGADDAFTKEIRASLGATQR